MRAWIFSDLHLEFEPSFDQLRIPEADVCLCAGDVLDGGVARSIEWLGTKVAPHMPVVFVAGNHEFFRSSIKEGLAAGYEAANRYENVFLLDGDVLLLNGFRFVGATLWTDFMLFGDPRLPTSAAKEQLNDYKQIKFSKTPFKKFTPRESQGLHFTARNYIDQVLWTPSKKPTIVLSHHAPSIMSVAKEFLRDPLTPAFASSLEPNILEYEPLLWVHGHMHHSSDYQIGKTRVICNPRGYPDEPSPNFDPVLVVDLAEMANA